MTSEEIKEKYLKFFEKRGHVRIEPSPLVLEADPTTLFTSSGMQQLVPYLKGEPHPLGKKLVDCQPSLRLQDLDEVADNRHFTFFEMLGNWSLGNYFKKEQLAWCWEFFTKELSLDPQRLYVSIFAGYEAIPQDNESLEVWRKLGVAEKNIHFYGVEQNWWSRSGTPEAMPAGEIGGVDSEIFYEFDVSHDPKFGKFCHPNCECGKFLEIGNSVFLQYLKNQDGKLSELPQKNVDFGGGVDRIAAVLNNDPDTFKIDVFKEVVAGIEREIGTNYNADAQKDKSIRIIADHLRAACSLLAEGIIPANKLHGYALRRLIRRAMFHFHLLGSGISGGAISHFAEGFRKHYSKIDDNWQFIEENLTGEAIKFESALKRGLAKLTAIVSEGVKVDGKLAFDLYQTEGFPLELTVEILKQNGMQFTSLQKNAFEEEFERHKNLSRTQSAGIFKGGLMDKSETVTKLHTATHLFHAALREILGESVAQKGSNINSKRLRFDFSYNAKPTAEEIEKVEALVNQQIEKDLPVSFKTESLETAIARGALHFFAEKYGKTVKVYTIGSFSREVCGGPHVAKTGEIGRVKIIKQEKAGADIVRIYATFL